MKCNRHIIFSGLLCMFFLTLFHERIFAQFALSFNAISMYDDNSFSFYNKRADVYHQLFLNLSNDFNTDYTNLTLYSYNAGVVFRTYSDRMYSSHILGALYSIQLDHRDDDENNDEQDQADSLEVHTDELEAVSDSSNVMTVSDSTDVGDQNENPTAQVEKKAEEVNVSKKNIAQVKEVLKSQDQYIAATVIRELIPKDSAVTYLHLKTCAGGRFDKTEYAFYDDKSATFNVLLRKHFFGSLISRVQYEFEFKDYPNLDQFTHIEHNATLTLNSNIAASSEIFSAIDFGYKSYPRSYLDTTLIAAGTGKGKGGVNKFKRVISQVSTPSTNQITVSAGYVRKFDSTSSITMSYLRRMNPSNKARYIDRREFTGVLEDNIFDDRYGYQSHELNVFADAMLFRHVHITSEIYYEWKVYNRTATDVFGDPLASNAQRRDKRLGMQFQLLYPLINNSTGGSKVSIGGQYNFYRNQSNDEYHDYNIHQAAIIVEAEF